MRTNTKRGPFTIHNVSSWTIVEAWNWSMFFLRLFLTKAIKQSDHNRVCCGIAFSKTQFHCKFMLRMFSEQKRNTKKKTHTQVHFLMGSVQALFVGNCKGWFNKGLLRPSVRQVLCRFLSTLLLGMMATCLLFMQTWNTLFDDAIHSYITVNM